MQRFRDEETTISLPRYNSESVRQILARASEIESRPDTEALTPAQVETLGREIGLSPDAVRRALGELHPQTTAAVAVTAPATVIQTPPVALTQARAKQAYLPILLAAVLGPPAVFVISLLIAAFHGSSLIVPSLVALGLLFLFARAGWITKRARLSFLGLIFAPLMMLLACIANALGGGGSVIPTTEEGIPALLMAPLASVVHLGGALARKWWDNLPQTDDR
ncbi:MAG: hypothetical protein H7145_23860 [Akkermansiaceae bacterium]|nr:hypothetical protein [Armatimonadota bacterium]